MDATMDEAANTALLLEQHIHEKVMRALVDVTLAEPHKVSVLRALEQGSTQDVASYEYRRVLVLSLVNDYTFQQNLRQMVMTVLREEISSQVRTQVEFERHRYNSTLVSSSTTLAAR